MPHGQTPLSFKLGYECHLAGRRCPSSWAMNATWPDALASAGFTEPDSEAVLLTVPVSRTSLASLQVPEPPGIGLV